MFTTLSRTIKEAYRNFIRNGWLTVAAIGILLMSLYVISVLFVISITTNNVLKSIQDKVNVSVYFKADTDDSVIMNAKSSIEQNPDVQQVVYISRDQALANFKQDNANEKVIMDSLDEIGENPLLSSLVIRTKDPNNYSSLASYLQQAPFANSVDRVNYDRNKDVIDQLNSIVKTIQHVGIAISLVVALIAMLIISNTIRITIYTHRQEIEVMRLVGASNNFIRLPFIFEGLLYAGVASLLSLMLLYLSMYSLAHFAPSLRTFLPLESPKTLLFWQYLLEIIGLQLVLGIIFSTVSSFIAVRKYLKI